MNNDFIGALNNYCMKYNSFKEYDASKFYAKKLDDELTISYNTLVNFIFPNMVYTNSNIINNINYIDTVLGNDYEWYFGEIYQFYIVDVDTWRLAQYKKYLKINKIDSDLLLLYNEELEVYILGITHYGTNWDYVATNIKLNQKGGNKSC